MHTLVAIGYTRVIRRTLLQLLPGQYTTAYWTWEVEHSCYVPYETKASIAIEEAFQNSLPHVDLSTSLAAIPYTIDLVNKVQFRHSYNTQRNIQRCQLASGCTVQQLLTAAPSLASSSSGGTIQQQLTAIPSHSVNPTAGSPSSSSVATNSDDDVQFVKETKAPIKKKTATARKSPCKSGGGVTSGCGVPGLDGRFASYVKMVVSLTQEQDEVGIASQRVNCEFLYFLAMPNLYEQPDGGVRVW